MHTSEKCLERDLMKPIEYDLRIPTTGPGHACTEIEPEGFSLRHAPERPLSFAGAHRRKRARGCGDTPVVQPDARARERLGGPARRDERRVPLARARRGRRVLLRAGEIGRASCRERV